MRARQFDLIAFDWDGTLFDSTALITRCIQAAVVDVGGEPPSREAASYVIGMGLMQALAHAAPDVPPEKYPELGQRYRHHYIAQQHELSLFEGVLPLLAELKQRHHWLTVATGKSRQGLNEVLHTVELQGVFDGSRTADETAGKPHPRMLHELMREFGVSPERTLMIGDTTHDLNMAQAAGVHALSVQTGAHPPKLLNQVPHLESFRSINELAPWLIQTISANK